MTVGSTGSALTGGSAIDDSSPRSAKSKKSSKSKAEKKSKKKAKKAKKAAKRAAKAAKAEAVAPTSEVPAAAAGGSGQPVAETQPSATGVFETPARLAAAGQEDAGRPRGGSDSGSDRVDFRPSSSASHFKSNTPSPTLQARQGAAVPNLSGMSSIASEAGGGLPGAASDGDFPPRAPFPDELSSGNGAGAAEAHSATGRSTLRDAQGNVLSIETGTPLLVAQAAPRAARGRGASEPVVRMLDADRLLLDDSSVVGMSPRDRVGSLPDRSTDLSSSTHMPGALRGRLTIELYSASGLLTADSAASGAKCFVRASMGPLVADSTVVRYTPHGARWNEDLHLELKHIPPSQPLCLVVCRKSGPTGHAEIAAIVLELGLEEQSGKSIADANVPLKPIRADATDHGTLGVGWKWLPHPNLSALSSSPRAVLQDPVVLEAPSRVAQVSKPPQAMAAQADAAAAQHANTAATKRAHNAAAVSVQSAWRGHSGRLAASELKLQIEAAHQAETERIVAQQLWKEEQAAKAAEQAHRERLFLEEMQREQQERAELLEESNSAAQRIQCTFRGTQGRKAAEARRQELQAEQHQAELAAEAARHHALQQSVHERSAAATSVQRVWRGHSARSQLEAEKQQQEAAAARVKALHLREQKEAAAAVRIQAATRGHQGRTAARQVQLQVEDERRRAQETAGVLVKPDSPRRRPKSAPRQVRFHPPGSLSSTSVNASGNLRRSAEAEDTLPGGHAANDHSASDERLTRIDDGYTDADVKKAMRFMDIYGTSPKAEARGPPKPTRGGAASSAREDSGILAQFDGMGLSESDDDGDIAPSSSDLGPLVPGLTVETGGDSVSRQGRLPSDAETPVAAAPSRISAPLRPSAEVTAVDMSVAQLRQKINSEMNDPVRGLVRGAAKEHSAREMNRQVALQGQQELVSDSELSPRSRPAPPSLKKKKPPGAPPSQPPTPVSGQENKSPAPSGTHLRSASSPVHPGSRGLNTRRPEAPPSPLQSPARLHASPGGSARHHRRSTTSPNPGGNALMHSSSSRGAQSSNQRKSRRASAIGITAALFGGGLVAGAGADIDAQRIAEHDYEDERDHSLALSGASGEEGGFSAAQLAASAGHRASLAQSAVRRRSVVAHSAAPGGSLLSARNSDLHSAAPWLEGVEGGVGGDDDGADLEDTGIAGDDVDTFLSTRDSISPRHSLQNRLDAEAGARSGTVRGHGGRLQAALLPTQQAQEGGGHALYSAPPLHDPILKHATPGSPGDVLSRLGMSPVRGGDDEGEMGGSFLAPRRLAASASAVSGDAQPADMAARSPYGRADLRSVEAALRAQGGLEQDGTPDTRRGGSHDSDAASDASSVEELRRNLGGAAYLEELQQGSTSDEGSEEAFRGRAGTQLAMPSSQLRSRIARSEEHRGHGAARTTTPSQASPLLSPAAGPVPAGEAPANDSDTSSTATMETAGSSDSFDDTGAAAIQRRNLQLTPIRTPGKGVALPPAEHFSPPRVRAVSPVDEDELLRPPPDLAVLNSNAPIAAGDLTQVLQESARVQKEQNTTHRGVGVSVSRSWMQIVEGGSADMYSLQLDARPRAPVTVSAYCGPGKKVHVSPTTLVFTPRNWFLPQIVRVSALDDLATTGVARGIVLHACASTDTRYGPSCVVPPVKVFCIDSDEGFLYACGDASYNKLALASGFFHLVGAMPVPKAEQQAGGQHQAMASSSKTPPGAQSSSGKPRPSTRLVSSTGLGLVKAGPAGPKPTMAASGAVTADSNLHPLMSRRHPLDASSGSAFSMGGSTGGAGGLEDTGFSSSMVPHTHRTLAEMTQDDPGVRMVAAAAAAAVGAVSGTSDTSAMGTQGIGNTSRGNDGMTHARGDTLAARLAALERAGIAPSVLRDPYRNPFDRQFAELLRGVLSVANTPRLITLLPTPARLSTVLDTIQDRSKVAVRRAWRFLLAQGEVKEEDEGGLKAKYGGVDSSLSAPQEHDNSTQRRRQALSVVDPSTPGFMWSPDPAVRLAVALGRKAPAVKLARSERVFAGGAAYDDVVGSGAGHPGRGVARGSAETGAFWEKPFAAPLRHLRMHYNAGGWNTPVTTYVLPSSLAHAFKTNRGAGKRPSSASTTSSRPASAGSVQPPSTPFIMHPDSVPEKDASPSRASVVHTVHHGAEYIRVQYSAQEMALYRLIEAAARGTLVLGPGAPTRMDPMAPGLGAGAPIGPLASLGRASGDPHATPAKSLAGEQATLMQGGGASPMRGGRVAHGNTRGATAVRMRDTSELGAGALAQSERVWQASWDTVWVPRADAHAALVKAEEVVRSAVLPTGMAGAKTRSQVAGEHTLATPGSEAAAPLGEGASGPPGSHDGPPGVAYFRGVPIPPSSAMSGEPFVAVRKYKFCRGWVTEQVPLRALRRSVPGLKYGLISSGSNQRDMVDPLLDLPDADEKLAAGAFGSPPPSLRGGVSIREVTEATDDNSTGGVPRHIKAAVQDVTDQLAADTRTTAAGIVRNFGLTRQVSRRPGLFVPPPYEEAIAAECVLDEEATKRGGRGLETTSPKRSSKGFTSLHSTPLVQQSLCSGQLKLQAPSLLPSLLSYVRAMHRWRVHAAAWHGDSVSPSRVVEYSPSAGGYDISAQASQGQGQVQSYSMSDQAEAFALEGFPAGVPPLHMHRLHSTWGDSTAAAAIHLDTPSGMFSPHPEGLSHAAVHVLRASHRGGAYGKARRGFAPKAADWKGLNDFDNDGAATSPARAGGLRWGPRRVGGGLHSRMGGASAGQDPLEAIYASDPADEAAEEISLLLSKHSRVPKRPQDMVNFDFETLQPTARAQALAQAGGHSSPTASLGAPRGWMVGGAAARSNTQYAVRRRKLSSDVLAPSASAASLGSLASQGGSVSSEGTAVTSGAEGEMDVTSDEEDVWWARESEERVADGGGKSSLGGGAPPVKQQAFSGSVLQSFSLNDGAVKRRGSFSGSKAPPRRMDSGRRSSLTGGPPRPVAGAGKQAGAVAAATRQGKVEQALSESPRLSQNAAAQRWDAHQSLQRAVLNGEEVKGVPGSKAWAAAGGGKKVPAKKGEGGLIGLAPPAGVQFTGQSRDGPASSLGSQPGTTSASQRYAREQLHMSVTNEEREQTRRMLHPGATDGQRKAGRDSTEQPSSPAARARLAGILKNLSPSHESSIEKRHAEQLRALGFTPRDPEAPAPTDEEVALTATQLRRAKFKAGLTAALHTGHFAVASRNRKAESKEREAATRFGFESGDQGLVPAPPGSKRGMRGGVRGASRPGSARISANTAAAERTAAALTAKKDSARSVLGAYIAGDVIVREEGGQQVVRSKRQGFLWATARPGKFRIKLASGGDVVAGYGVAKQSLVQDTDYAHALHATVGGSSPVHAPKRPASARPATASTTGSSASGGGSRRWRPTSARGSANETYSGSRTYAPGMERKDSEYFQALNKMKTPQNTPVGGGGKGVHPQHLLVPRDVAALRRRWAFMSTSRVAAWEGQGGDGGAGGASHAVTATTSRMRNQSKKNKEHTAEQRMAAAIRAAAEPDSSAPEQGMESETQPARGTAAAELEAIPLSDAEIAEIAQYNLVPSDAADMIKALRRIRNKGEKDTVLARLLAALSLENDDISETSVSLQLQIRARRMVLAASAGSPPRTGVSPPKNGSSLGRSKSPGASGGRPMSASLASGRPPLGKNMGARLNTALTAPKMRSAARTRLASAILFGSAGSAASQAVVADSAARGVGAGADIGDALATSAVDGDAKSALMAWELSEGYAGGSNSADTTSKMGVHRTGTDGSLAAGGLDEVSITASAARLQRRAAHKAVKAERTNRALALVDTFDALGLAPKDMLAMSWRTRQAARAAAEASRKAGGAKGMQGAPKGVGAAASDAQAARQDRETLATEATVTAATLSALEVPTPYDTAYNPQVHGRKDAMRVATLTRDAEETSGAAYAAAKAAQEAKRMEQRTRARWERANAMVASIGRLSSAADGDSPHAEQFVGVTPLSPPRHGSAQKQDHVLSSPSTQRQAAVKRFGQALVEQGGATKGLASLHRSARWYGLNEGGGGDLLTVAAAMATIKRMVRVVRQRKAAAKADHDERRASRQGGGVSGEVPPLDLDRANDSDGGSDSTPRSLSVSVRGRGDWWGAAVSGDTRLARHSEEARKVSRAEATKLFSQLQLSVKRQRVAMASRQEEISAQHKVYLKLSALKGGDAGGYEGVEGGANDEAQAQGTTATFGAPSNGHHTDGEGGSSDDDGDSDDSTEEEAAALEAALAAQVGPGDVPGGDSAESQAKACVRVSHIAAGGNHSLLIVSGGVLFAAGCGSHGQLGRGGRSDAKAPCLVRSLSRVPIVKVAAGAEHSLAVSVDGHAFAWGRGREGQLGLLGGSESDSVAGMTGAESGPSTYVRTREGGSDALTPRLVATLASRGPRARVVHVAAGGRHSLFLTVSGSVFACGENTAGQCGLGHRDNVFVPTQVSVPGGASVYHAAAGTRHSACVAGAGDVFTWGYGGDGRLGHGGSADASVPTLVDSISVSGNTVVYQYHDDEDEEFDGSEEVSSMMGGGEVGYYSPARDTSSRAATGRMPQQRALYRARGVRVRMVACGDAHTAALTEHKTVLTWGRNSSGQLGLGHTYNRSHPELVWPLAGKQAVSEITLGKAHSAFVTENGGLFTCGDWELGALGLGRASRGGEDTKPSDRRWQAPPGKGPLHLIIPGGKLTAVTSGEGGSRVVAVPRLARALVGARVLTAAAGHSHTLLLCDSPSSAPESLVPLLCSKYHSTHKQPPGALIAYYAALGVGAAGHAWATARQKADHVTMHWLKDAWLGEYGPLLQLHSEHPPLRGPVSPLPAPVGAAEPKKSKPKPKKKRTKRIKRRAKSKARKAPRPAAGAVPVRDGRPDEGGLQAVEGGALPPRAPQRPSSYATSTARAALVYGVTPGVAATHGASLQAPGLAASGSSGRAGAGGATQPPLQPQAPPQQAAGGVRGESVTARAQVRPSSAHPTTSSTAALRGFHGVQEGPSLQVGGGGHGPRHTAAPEVIVPRLSRTASGRRGRPASARPKLREHTAAAAPRVRPSSALPAGRAGTDDDRHRGRSGSGMVDISAGSRVRSASEGVSL